MSGWYGTEAFERLAQSLTVTRFIAGPDWDEKRLELRAQIAPDLLALGFDTEDEEQRARFDAEFEVRRRALKAMDYATEYLRTEHWQTVRRCALQRARHACQVCSRTESLHVHHRKYAELGSEGPEDVTVLCAGCHHLFHTNRDLARA